MKNISPYETFANHCPTDRVAARANDPAKTAARAKHRVAALVEEKAVPAEVANSAVDPSSSR